MRRTDGSVMFDLYQAAGVLLFGVAPALGGLAVLRVFLEERGRHRVPVFLYHRFVDRQNERHRESAKKEPVYCCYADSFREHLRTLKEEGYRTLSMSEFASAMDGNRSETARSVVLTFDDGYTSNHSLALPILREFGYTATVYAALEPDEDTRRQVEGVDAFLTVGQMKELLAAGCEVGSHTVTHCILSELQDEAVRFELQESKRRLEQALGVPCRHLAVPRSGWSRRVRRFIEEAGYETACFNGKGSASLASDKLAIPRIVVDSETDAGRIRSFLTPGGRARDRIVGAWKRLPEIVGGPSGARAVRDIIRRAGLGGLLASGRAEKVLVAIACLYAAVGVWFWTAWAS